MKLVLQVDFYLKQQEDAAKESREVTVRNRRLARMNQLESDGLFFTEVGPSPTLQCFALLIMHGRPVRHERT